MIHEAPENSTPKSHAPPPPGSRKALDDDIEGFFILRNEWHAFYRSFNARMRSNAAMLNTAAPIR